MTIAMILVSLFVLVVAYLYMFDTLSPTLVGQIVLSLVVLGVLLYWISPGSMQNNMPHPVQKTEAAIPGHGMCRRSHVSPSHPLSVRECER
jgi:O-antigen/teichoic acid export membrane protein